MEEASVYLEEVAFNLLLAEEGTPVSEVCRKRETMGQGP